MLKIYILGVLQLAVCLWFARAPSTFLIRTVTHLDTASPSRSGSCIATHLSIFRDMLDVIFQVVHADILINASRS